MITVKEVSQSEFSFTTGARRPQIVQLTTTFAALGALFKDSAIFYSKFLVNHLCQICVEHETRVIASLTRQWTGLPVVKWAFNATK
jgi:hypothetical protein